MKKAQKVEPEPEELPGVRQWAAQVHRARVRDDEYCACPCGRGDAHGLGARPDGEERQGSVSTFSVNLILDI